MNRRDFTKGLAVVLGTIGSLSVSDLLSAQGLPVSITARRPITIADIIVVSYQEALAATIKYEGMGSFVTKELGQLEAEGRIVVQPLGPSLELDGKSYEIKEFSVPTVWTKKDDLTNSTENQKIALAEQLMVNTWDCHDYWLQDLLDQNPSKRLVVSKNFRYLKSETVLIPYENEYGNQADAYMFRSHTAYAVVD